MAGEGVEEEWRSGGGGTGECYAVSLHSYET